MYWESLLPRLKKRVQMTSGRILAVPYFLNISVLANNITVDEDSTKSWYSLAEACDKFEASHPGKLFFDFVKETDENYNSIYFEILLSLCLRCPSGPNGCGLGEWLRSREAAEALVLFWRLCHKAHSHRRAAIGDGSRQVQI